MNIWLFQSLVVAGTVRDCIKWAENFNTKDYTYKYCWSARKSRGYICIKSTTDPNSLSSLQRISAEKVLHMFENGSLTADALQNLPEELLTAIVLSIPVVVPTTEQDPNPVNAYSRECKKPSFKFNFAKRCQLMEQIQALRPDLNADWQARLNNEQCVLNYQFWTGALMPKPADIQLILKGEQIHADVLVRQCCDWDRPGQNNFSKLWAIQNGETVFERKDLPRAVNETDHPLVRQYGHLLRDYEDIQNDERTEFTSESLGEFKLFYCFDPLE